MKYLICKLFGHKWIYYTIDTKDFRVCRCCNRMEYYAVIKGVDKKPFWRIAVQYKTKGAKIYVEGYGK